MESYRTWDFKRMFDVLPESVQRRARQKFDLFLHNPYHPSLRRHRLTCYPPHESVSITMDYRAIFRPGERLGNHNVYVWVWIGSHSDFERTFP